MLRFELPTLSVATILFCMTLLPPAAVPAAAQDNLPFSATVTVGHMVFVSGQIGKDPETGEFAGSDISAQTRQALLNIERHLNEADSDLTRVVKTTVFLKNIGDYDAMNTAYRRMFGGMLPARSTVGVADLAGGALIEIEAVAVNGEYDGKIDRK